MTLKNDTTRDIFIEQNLRLVHSLAHRYTGKGIEYDDLYSAGCVGLIKAYDGFDSSRGFSFSTYAVPVILGEIRRLFRDGGSVKVSRTLKDLSLKVAHEEGRLSKELMRPATVSEIAKALEIEPEEVAMAQSAAMPTLSLTYESDDGDKICDIASGESEEDLVGKIALKRAIEKLNETDKKIIYLRYFEDMTQAKTAESLNMTQVSVSRREKAILQKLRYNLQTD